MVVNLIDKSANKVVLSHIDRLVDGMNYIVVNNNKKAVFGLKNINDTFADIKDNIAKYFGLPVKKIFLRNSYGEIMLSS